MDVFKTRYYKYCRMQLLWIGMWPYQNKLAALPIRMSLLVMAAVFINGEIQHIIKSRDQLQLIIEAIPYLMTVCALSIKYMTIWIRSEATRKTMNRIQYDWHNAALNNEDHILKANAEKGWRFCRLYMLIVYMYASGVLSFLVMPEILNMSISNNITRLVVHVRGEFFLDQDKYHSLILFYLTGSVIVTIGATTAMTLQWIMIINHACGMFAIFGYRLEHAFHISSRKHDRRDTTKKILVHMVEHHKEIIKYIATVNSNYTVYYVPLLIMGIIILSTFLIQVYIAINESAPLQDVFFLAMFFTICVWYIFVDTVPPQKLIDASSNVFRQIYNGEWYNASISDQKALLFIMQNCMEPITITTANIITLSMEMFGMVVRVSMSFFTVLCSIS